MDRQEKDFLEAFEKYADDIYRHCYFRVYDKEFAEDLVQETFTKTWEYMVKGKDIKNIRAFLYRVAVNLIIDNSRKKKAVFLDDLGLKERDGPLRLYNMEAEIFNKVESKELIKMLDELSENQKQVILMRYVDDFLPSEIAEILEESANAVSVRLNQGMNRLREIIKEKYKEA